MCIPFKRIHDQNVGFTERLRSSPEPSRALWPPDSIGHISQVFEPYNKTSVEVKAILGVKILPQADALFNQRAGPFTVALR